MTPAISLLLEKAQRGDNHARDAAYSLAFFRLKGIASALLQRERPGHTLQPTALVSELFLKLHRLEITFLSEDHFFRLSARAMRQVLIDHSRRSRPARTISADQIPELLLARDSSHPEEGLAVKGIFEKLRIIDSKVAETVWMRAVHGMTIDELSRMQSRANWRVRADYDFGLKWMANRLKR